MTDSVFIFQHYDCSNFAFLCLRVWGKPGGAGRADPAGQFPGLGSTLTDQEGQRPTPLPVWVLPSLQQGDQRLCWQNQVPVQEQTTGECVFASVHSFNCFVITHKQQLCISAFIFFDLCVCLYVRVAVECFNKTDKYFLCAADIRAGGDRAHWGWPM